MARQLSDRATTIAEFVTVTLIWGSTWLVIKGQLGSVPAAWSVTYRFVIAGAVLTAVTVATGRWRALPWRGHAFAVVIGVVQFMANFNLVYAAEATLTSGLVALCFALLVVPNTLFARVFLGTRLTARFAVGTLLGIAGMLLLFGPDLAAASGRATAMGLGLVVIAVLSASIANVLQAGGLARSLPPQTTLALSMLYGAAIDAVYALATAGPPVFDPRPEYWAGMLYLALGASVVAFTLYYRLIRRIGPGLAAYSSVVVPVVALFLSTLFEGYRLTWLAASGAALALAGLVVALSGRVPAAPRENPDTPG